MYPFYGSDEHAAIINVLESASPAAVIAVTGRYPALCGALDPFPLIEDGDFAIPTGNIRPEESGPVLDRDGQPAEIEIRSERWASTARNLVATRGAQAGRMTIAAHIDTKPGTPGAVDNAAGVAALVLLAGLLSPRRRQDRGVGVELLVVNGEDHYAAPGEVAWLSDTEGTLGDIALFVNIDGAGYLEGRTAYSTYNVPAHIQSRIDAAFEGREDLVQGRAWYQSDHAIFAMQGRPALAFTTEHVEEMLESLFHAPTDTPDKVDPALVVGIAMALEDLVLRFAG
jgi:aminopeptidase YwaD